MKNEEHSLQVACVRWFSLQYKEQGKLLMAYPAGGKRHPTVAAKMKAEGAKSGVPDLFLAVTQFGLNEERYGGLWIEMKTPKGVLRKNQKEYLRMLHSYGYAVAVCRSFEEFQKTLVDYMMCKHENDPKLTQ